MGRHSRRGGPATSAAAVPSPKKLAAQCIHVLKVYVDGSPHTDHDAYETAKLKVEINGARQRCSDLRGYKLITWIQIGIKKDGKPDYWTGRTPSNSGGHYSCITPVGLKLLNGLNGLSKELIEMNEMIKPADLVEEFVRLRNTKEKLEKEFEERVKDQLTGRMEEIKSILLDKLNELGIEFDRRQVRHRLQDNRRVGDHRRHA